jgi:hypothetical protein
MKAALEGARDLGPYAFPAKFRWLKSRFSDIRQSGVPDMNKLLDETNKEIPITNDQAPS